MSYVVYASPAQVPPPKVDPWSHLEMTWQGHDGSVWSLCGGRNKQAISLQAGVRGFTFPPFEEHTSSSPARRGQWFRGYRELAREVFWPLMVWRDTSSAEWLAWDAAFRASMRPDRAGMWTVRQPESGVSRSLMLRLRSDGDPSWLFSPGLVGWAPYQYTLVADDPLWAGATVSRKWENSSGTPFFGSGNAAPTYFLTKAATAETASIENPGDVPVRPVWELRDQIDAGAMLTVDGATIGVPFLLEEGDVLRIDTEAGTARLNGERVAGDLNPREFRQWIPDGGEVPLGISFSGTGSVRCTIQPKHFAAW